MYENQLGHVHNQTLYWYYELRTNKCLPMIHLTFHLIYYLGDVESSVEEIFFNWHYTWLDRLKGEFARWKDNNKNNFLGKIIRSSRSLYLDLDQCGQIWRNFTVLVTFYKPLAYLLRVYLVFDKFLNLLWQFFTLLWKFSLFYVA